MNKTRFDKLLADLRDNYEEDFANDLAITLYKANMWDKYQSENRLDESRLQALEATHDFKEVLAKHKDAFKKGAEQYKDTLAQLDAEGVEGAEDDYGHLKDMWDWCTDIDPEDEEDKIVGKSEN